MARDYLAALARAHKIRPVNRTQEAAEYILRRARDVGRDLGTAYHVELFDWYRSRNLIVPCRKPRAKRKTIRKPR